MVSEARSHSVSNSRNTERSRRKTSRHRSDLPSASALARIYI